ncbi:MAG TPA: ATP-binding protein [Chloroflexota bacterium]|nr:ATP-binding protein [Chloroflexota bacterium]
MNTRTDGTSHLPWTGAGIGLASTRQIVEQHGGTMEVHSEEGSGSTFTLRVPISGEPSPSADRPSPPARFIQNAEELAGNRG